MKGYQIINTHYLHEAVERAMNLLDAGEIVSGENQDTQDELKDISVVIEVANIKDLTISKAIPGDLYSLVEY